MASRINFQVGYTVDKAGLTEMQSLFQRIANMAKEPGQELNTGLQKAAATANTLDGILEKTFNTNLGTLNVTKFNQELSKSGLTLKTVQSSLSGIGNQGATAYNRLAQAVLGTNLQLKESSKLLDSMATTMTNTVKWGITSSIFNSMTNAIQRAYSYSKQLDTSLNDIRIVTDKSAENMEQFAETANTAAKNLGASTLDYTNAALIYYQQGLSDEEAQARAETTVKAANITGQTGEAVSEQLTAVWNGYKVTAEETEAYVDKLAAVAATTAADLEELSVGMSKVASAANAMGVDFDDLNAQIATIVSVTRQAPESVGTALKTIYARLGDLKVDGVDEFGVKLGEVSAQMQTMGIQILDQEGNLRDMSGVIAEVAQKWGTWTEAQRQAAAVAMAGKRQYNNLIALFDNWDMYTDALNTSQEALGTLQHQQDIYMESTAAKLKTLKATWQDLYDDLIDQDELNTGIEGLTNFVQVFDNFIESFGGGIKSIGAFGAIVANIFNQQIVNGINAAIQRQNIFKQNLELAQANAQVRANGVAELGANATPQDLAIQANTKEQLIYAQKIYDARIGLNQEQTNSLINYQKELGELKGQVTLNDQLIEKLNKEYQLTEQYGGLQEWNGETIEKINLDYADRIEKIEQIKKLITDITTGEINVGAAKTKISALTKSIGTEEAKRVQEAMNLYDTTYDIEVHEDKINELLNGQIAKYKNAQVAAEKINDARIKNIDLNANYQNTKQEADAMLELGEKSIFTSQAITTVTSSLSTMAMAWSSVSSLIQTWNDETASIGDKITQSFITLGMTIPMVISSFSKLEEVFGISSSLLDVYNTKLVANTAASKAQEIAKKAQTVAEAANTAQVEANTAWQAYAEAAALGRVDADNLMEIAINKTTIANTANTAANVANTASLEAEAAAATAAAEANAAYNASLLANPYILAAAAALVVLVGSIAAVNAHYKKLREKAHAAAEESAKLAAETRSEVEAHKELIQQYDELKEKYDAGTASKEDLWEVTGKILDAYDLEGSRLDMLTGKYDQVTEAIKRKQKAEQEELIQEDKKAIKDSAEAALEEGRKAGGSRRASGDKYRVTLDSGLAGTGDYQEAIRRAKEIFGDNVNTSEGFIGDFTFDTSNVKNIMEGISKLEQWRDALKELGYETEPAYQHIESVINAFNDEGSLDTIKENQSKALEDMLSNSILSVTNSQEEFDNEIINLQSKLKEALSEGIIPSDTDINRAIADYIGTLNTSLATNFTMEQGVREKFGDSLNEELLQIFMSLGDDSKIDFVDLFDFSIDTEKGKQLLQDYQDYFNNQSSNAVAIPVSFQTQLNDDILKGKDISKSDWESLTASSPDAESILGSRESFNNKSIGERLALMKELNAAIKEQNVLTVEQYDITNEASKNIIEDINNQISSTEEKIRNIQNAIGTTIVTKEGIEEARERIKELQGDIEELTNEKHEIEIGVDMELPSDNILQSAIGDVVTEADQLLSATEAIGEGWTVAAENVAQFASAFPDLMADVEAVNRLEDGSIQLNKDRVNEILQGNQDIMESNKEIVLQQIDDKLAQLQAEKTFQQAKLDALNEYLEADINNEQAETDATSKIKQAAQDYANTLRENDLIDDANAVNQAITNSETGANSMISSLSAINEAIKTIHNNYANMLVEGASMADVTAKAGGGVRVSSSFTSTKNADYNGGDAIKKAAVEAAKQARDDAEARISEIDKEIASYEGFRSDVLSRTSKANKAADRVKAGKAGKEEKGKKGGGGKDKKDKDEKKYEDEFDRYWEIKKAIDAVDRAVKRLDKDQENLYGYELIKSLKVENQLLEQQKANYEALAAAQRQEAAELQGVLAGHGVAFDASGAITNYAAATADALAKYNAAITQYNAGLIGESELDVYEKNYEAFKKALERYETLFYTEMQDTQDKLDEIWRNQLANNLKAWEVEIQLKLDMKELKRGWNDFIKEVTEDFQKVFKDLRVDVRNFADDAKTYIGDEGTINTIIKGVHDVTNEIDKLRGGGSSDMFESISQAQEKLKELNTQLEDSGRALHDLWKEAWDTYLDGIDQVADKFDDLIDRFEKINDELDFQKEIIQLLYGDEAYKLMNKLYEGQEKNTLAQIQSLKQQKDMWEDLWRASGATMENQAEWNEDQKKYYDEWMEAQSDLNDLVLEYIQILKDDYLNTVYDILKELEGAVTGSSLDRVNTQWERISDHAEKYYDSVEGAYKIQSLANKIDEGIAATTNLKAQQKLQELREREIDYLREKETLTEYDLQAAEARYDIMLKEIALEEAQNNKTSMKLTRNEQGNWSYQYVADQGDVASKQQELLDAYNNLYQLASDAYEANLEALTELQQKYLDSARELYENENISEEERQERLLELRTWYLNEYRLLAEENTLYRNDLEEGASALLLEIYRQDQSAYEAMTETEQTLLDALLTAHIDGFMDLEDRLKENYNNIADEARNTMAETREDWLSSAQQIADIWNADDGFSVKIQVINAYDRISDANERYKQLVDECAIAVERDFGEAGITGAIQKAEDATDDLKYATADMVSSSIGYLAELKYYVDMVADAWRSVQQEILDAIALIEEYLKYVGEYNRQQQQQIAAAQAAQQAAAAKVGSGSGDGGNNEPNNPSPSKNKYWTQQDRVDYHQYTENTKWREEQARIYHNQNVHYTTGNYTYKKRTFATGGYTGEWNNGSTDGRLAVLHQKELVLNEDDTKNFLSGITMMRDMSSLNGSISESITRAVANMIYSLGKTHVGSTGNISSTSNDNKVFNIQAEFPNANDVNEIREAILSLPNMASQYTNNVTL